VKCVLTLLFYFIVSDIAAQKKNSLQLLNKTGVSLSYEYLGDVYSTRGKKEKAVEWFRKALTIDPSKKEIGQKIPGLGL